LTVAPPDASEAAIAAAPATELFVARASARDPTFRLEEHAAGVAAVCDRTAGLPLAIELAAARVGVLTPAQIAERMTDGGLDLTLDLRDTPERHRSLRATLDWSYDLLSPAQRDAFERFAVFVGGAAPEIAEHVADVPTDRLEALVSQGCSSGVRERRAAPASRCSNRSATSPLSGCKGATITRRSGIATPGSSSRLPSPAASGSSVATARHGGTVWRMTSRTSGRPSSGRSSDKTAKWHFGSRSRSADLRWLTLEGFQWLERARQLPGEADPGLEARALPALSAFALPGALTIDEVMDAARRAAAAFRSCGARPERPRRCCRSRASSRISTGSTKHTS
jgi:hypothetical protein